jgi:hypothetical protein
MKLFVSLASCVVLAGVAHAQLERVEATANLADGHLSPLAGIASLRNGGYSTRGITPGDTYDAAIIGQTATAAAFLTSAGRVTTFEFDSLSTLHGTLVGSNAEVAIGEAFIQVNPTTYLAVVAAYTTDSSPLWLNGISVGGNPIIQGRFDVGAGAFTNGILWDNLPGEISDVTIVSAVYADGTLLATSSALPNGHTLPEMGALVVWNGIVGSPVDEIHMIFEITVVPAPASLALLGIGGMVATRRRRA